jgi:glycosyltransferase involved in cell wall biosynthesis
MEIKKTLVLINSEEIGGAEIQALAQSKLIRRFTEQVEIGILCSKMPTNKSFSLIATEHGILVRYFVIDLATPGKLIKNATKLAFDLRKEYAVVFSLTHIPNIICALFSIIGGFGVWEQRDVSDSRGIGLADRLLMFGPRKIISNSSNGAQFIQKLAFGLRKSLVLPNLIDPRFADHSETDELGRDLKFTFIYVANYSHVKGHIKLLNAWEKFKASNDNDCQLILTGNIGSAYKDVAEKINQMPSRASVQFLPKSTAQEIDQLFSRCAVNIIASYSEGRSNVVDRASQRGLVTIGSKLPSVIEQLSELNHEFLCDPNSVKDLARTIEIAYMKRNRLANIGKLNKQKIDKYFRDSEISWLQFLSSNLQKRR